jgi:hypothetical protein
VVGQTKHFVTNSRAMTLNTKGKVSKQGISDVCIMQIAHQFLVSREYARGAKKSMVKF